MFVKITNIYGNKLYLIVDDGITSEIQTITVAFNFKDLEIVRGQEDNADNTFINFESETLAVLNNVDTANISQSDLV